MSAPRPNEATTKEMFIGNYDDITFPLQLYQSRLSFHHLGWLACTLSCLSCWTTPPPENLLYYASQETIGAVANILAHRAIQ